MEATTKTPQETTKIIILTDKEIESLGFKLLPKVTCGDEFTYRIAEIKTNSSLIEIVNEYQGGKIINQFCNYEITDETSKPVDVQLIEKLKQIILQ